MLGKSLLSLRGACRRLATCQSPRLVMIVLLLFPSVSHALPWDIDMYKQESFKANEMARSPVKGTVPRGYKPFTMTAEEAEKKLKNPVKADDFSIWRGKRLWNANCLTCHGDKGDAKDTVVGPLVGAPDLLNDFYKKRTDGKVYSVIQLGGANMPRYGYKFSEQEKWDIVNYLRYLQGNK